MDYYELNIDGIQFKKHYLCYVIIIKHNTKGEFYYIGQTGDRNYMTARPAFRRLAGHLSDIGQSTENQIYRQIAEKILRLEIEKKKKFTEEIKNKVSSFLVNSSIKMIAFPIKKFDEHLNKQEHIENRNYVENIEKWIIQKMKFDIGVDRILNKKINKPNSTKDCEEKADIIIKIVKKNRL